MARKEELEISISNTGEVTINVIGAKGSSCVDMTKDLIYEVKKCFLIIQFIFLLHLGGPF